MNKEETKEFSKISEIKNRKVKNISVYDFELEKEHCFFANNILVANCRCMWVPIPPEEAVELTETWRRPSASMIERFGSLLFGEKRKKGGKND